MKQVRFRFTAALIAGVVFGLGLAVSGMLNPRRVQAFLDLFGDWDPSLGLVLGAAVAVAFAGMQLMRRMRHPLLDQAFFMPTKTAIDTRLVLGSAIFGVGWGIGGLCPGPAIASLTLGLPATSTFVAAMLLGMVIHDRLFARTM